MLAYIWPVLLIIASNVLYHFCAKETPSQMNVLVSLTLTYLVAAGITFGLYCCTGGVRHLSAELRIMNWTTGALALSIIGIELGYIFMYRVGWPMSSSSLTANIGLAVVLLLVGFVCYHEQITLNKALGVALCLVGLFFLNR